MDGRSGPLGASTSPTVGVRAPYHSAIAPKRTPARAKARPGRALPPVRLGAIAPNGVGASLYGLLERGLERRPTVARSTRGTAELRFREKFAPVRIVFADDEVVVGDVVDRAEARDRPDLVISGSLPDIVQLATAPLIGGVPRPTNARGRAAIARIAQGRVKIEGSPQLARRLLRLLEI